MSKSYYCKMYMDGEWVRTFYTYEEYDNFIQNIDINNYDVYFVYSYEEEQ